MSSNDPDYYRLLGLPREAPEREVKKAYYEAARRLHPDKAKSPEEAAKNASDLALISKAYNTLKDPAKRAEYDNQIKGRPAGGSSAPPSARPSPPPAAAPVASPQASIGRGNPVAGGAGAPVTGGPGSAQPAARSATDQMAQKKSIAQKAFVKGMQHFKRGEYKEAVGFFEVAVQNDPDSEVQYHVKLAQSLLKTRGSFTRMVEHAEKACQMDAYNVEYKLLLGEVYEIAGVLSKAKSIYEDVLRWDGSNASAKSRLSLLGNAAGSSKKDQMMNTLNKITSMFKKKS